MTTLSDIAANISSTLATHGVAALASSVGPLGVRVDVRTKDEARKASEMLRAAGLLNTRALFERRGLWLVVGQLPR